MTSNTTQAAGAPAATEAPSGWDANPDGVVPGQERGPRMNPDTGFWEGAESDEEDVLADDAVAAGRTPGDTVPGVSTAALVRAMKKFEGRAAIATPAPASPEPLQPRVQPWLVECFGPMIAGDREERNHRFLEESLELVQACGCSASEAHQLVDYVFGRPVGEKDQEVGGVMITLAALCLANGLDMHDAGERELARIWTMVEKIRAKQAAKPKHSPLPVAAPASVQPSDWHLIEEAPKDGRTLLLGYFNSAGKWRTLRGQWMSAEYIAQNWEEPDEGEPGWYETVVESDDTPNAWRTKPTHYQLLPKQPPAPGSAASEVKA